LGELSDQYGWFRHFLMAFFSWLPLKPLLDPLIILGISLARLI
jgi:hypothetical protein